jgi:hypothetical protein
MRSSLRGLLTGVLLGLIVGPLLGQAPPLAQLETVLESGVDAPLLLSNPGVKREIKLTDKQDNEIHKIVKEVFDKYQPEFRKAGRDREKLMQIGMESTRETRESVRRALPDILKPEQLKRLNQIQIQVNGIASFKRPEVQKELKLTDRQLEEIAKIGAGLKQDIAGLVKDASSAPLRKMPGALRKAKELKESATHKAVERLTEEQRQTWKDMQGEKFDFQMQLPMRPGGRP